MKIGDPLEPATDQGAIVSKTQLEKVKYYVNLAAFLRREVVIFNRPANAVVLRSASLFGIRETTRSLTGVIRAEARTNMFGSTRRTTWRPVLIFDAAPTLPLTAVFIGGTSARTCVDAINHWLTHPIA